MANMTTQQRIDCRNELIRLLSGEGVGFNLTKPDLQAAIDAADAWCNSNAASFNTALPVTARNNLTTAQKARLLAFVAIKRYATGA